MVPTASAKLDSASYQKNLDIAKGNHWLSIFLLGIQLAIFLGRYFSVRKELPHNEAGLFLSLFVVTTVLFGVQEYRVRALIKILQSKNLL